MKQEEAGCNLALPLAQAELTAGRGNRGIIYCILIAAVLTVAPAVTFASTQTCGSFYLRNDCGEIINPLSGENGDQPFSTRQTCGGCHDYEKITRGFHFQQGWESISDTFSTQRPWVLSDGMMGKH